MYAFVKHEAMPSFELVMRATTHTCSRARKSIAAAATCHSLRIFRVSVSDANAPRVYSAPMASSSTAAASTFVPFKANPFLPPPSSSSSSSCSSCHLTRPSSSLPPSVSSSFSVHLPPSGHERVACVSPSVSSSLSLSLSATSSSVVLFGGAKTAPVDRGVSESRFGREWARAGAFGAGICESGGWEVGGWKRRFGDWLAGGGGVIMKAGGRSLGVSGGVYTTLEARSRFGNACLCDHNGGEEARLSSRRADGSRGRGRKKGLGDWGGGSGAGAIQLFTRSFVIHFLNPGLSVPSDVYFRAIYASSLGGEGGFEGGAVDLDQSKEQDLDQSPAPRVGNVETNYIRRKELDSYQGALRLHSGAVSLPHPDKVEKGGEDAHFISSDEHAVGVADGVGGWAEVGIDAGQYARQLMNNSVLALRQEPHGLGNPLRVLSKAHERTKVQGSSTACILMLRDNVLHAANLGDSGFILIRQGRTVFKSPPQQHSFNFPYQLGSIGSDSPESADVYGLPVVPGDVIVVGTDGLFDNVYDTELATVVMHSINSGWGPQDTAQRIGAVARLRAQDKHRQSPFARAAQDAGLRFHGGKMDDITVVVSYVTGKEKPDAHQDRELGTA